MAFCQNCGAPIDDSANVCPQCGKAVNNTQQAQPAPAVGTVTFPIKKREIVTCIILSIITCGIYGLYWYFCLVNDLNTAVPQPGDQGAGMVLLLSIITCGIYSWFWLYKAGEKSEKIKAMVGEAPGSSSILYLLLAIFSLGIVVYCLIQNDLNKVASL